ncbi:MAG: DUF6164 family protein [Halofilum sp. (in: g-proteobacteria)]|nr:DUF6164 family protein [Halofilum sp. (in: g-proteobacteria)]
MARLLLNLRNVPADEADEVRALLETHRLAFYETAPGPLGITAGAIWLRHDEQHEQARALLASYQAERARRQRAAHEERLRAGTAETLLGRARQRPLATLSYVAIMAVLLYFTIRPFFGLAG